MNTATAIKTLDVSTEMSNIERVIIGGDLSMLSPNERTIYYKKICDSLGLNPFTKPFEYILLNGRLTLYARKDATDQLRSLKKVSIKISSREQIGEVYVVTAQAKLPDGREDESTGAVCISHLKGDALANAYLKCETKAKRRVTLSICGLGLLDETEVETIPDAKSVSSDLPRIFPEQPGENDGDQSEVNGFRFTLGSFKGRSPESVDVDRLRKWVLTVEDRVAKSGRTLDPEWQRNIDMAAEYVGAFENRKPEEQQ